MDRQSQGIVFLRMGCVHVRLRALAVLATVVLMAIGVSACGSGGSSSGSPSASVPGNLAKSTASSAVSAAKPSGHDGDGDIDTLGRGPYDTDNDAVLGYGPPADTADRRAIIALIKRYYKVAAADDGAKACSMLDSLIVESIEEEHHLGKGSRSLQGATCAQIMSKLFAHRHRELVEDVAAFRITTVELRGNRGMVLAPFSPTREMQLLVHRQHGVWTMDAPLDNGAQ